MKYICLVTIAVSICACNNINRAETNQDSQVTKERITMNDTLTDNRSEEEWKKILSTEQYYVLREKGTERPFTGKFNLNKENGIYTCAACGNELFTSEMKFDSHCGWPSFDREILGGKIKTAKDISHGMIRTEIMCASCGSHLGHLFDDGPTDTGMRYCVNSLSLGFLPNQ
jgi:methionine-R-sulfoxide reductase